MGSSLRVLAALALAAAACTVPTVELAGKACDLDGGHPCVEGYACVAGLCVEAGSAPDAGGPDAGGDGCGEGEERPCGEGLGDCLGSQRCQDGLWGACVEPAPAAERCDGRDNDCDGDTDEAEEVRLTASPCELTQGVCAGSRKSCIGGVEAPCEDADYGAAYRAGPETLCDGQDNNCDGRTDEGLDNDGDGWGVDVVCTKGSGDCDDWEPASYPGATEVCDGKDNDCNHQRDEPFGCPRGLDMGACSEGRLVCASDCSQPHCEPREICNGLDDDGKNGADDGIETPWGPSLGSSVRASRPQVAARLDGTFLVAHGSGSGVAVRHVAAGTAGPLQPVAGAVAPYALSHALLVHGAAGGGLSGVRLGSQGLQGGPLTVVDKPGVAVEGVTAMGLDTGSTLVAAIIGGQLHRVTVGDAPPQQPVDAIAPVDAEFPGGVALAYWPSGPLAIVEAAPTTPPRTSTLLIYPGYPRSGETPVAPLPSSMVDAREPSGAAGAVAFTVNSGAGRQVVLARAKTTALDPDDALVLPGGGEASSPALVVLGIETYFVAWVDVFSGRKMVRGRLASWNAAAKTWNLYPGETPFWHADGTTPVETCAAATDRTRFFVVFGTAGATDELFSKYVCP